MRVLDSLMPRQPSQLLRQRDYLGKDKAWKSNRNNPAASRESVGNLNPQPISLMNTPVQTAWRQDNEKVRDPFDLPQQRLVEMSLREILNVQKDAIAALLQSLAQ